MSEALTHTQLLAFERQITELLVQLQQEEQELLAGVIQMQPVFCEVGEVKDGLAGNLAMQMSACRAALARISAGEYGYCDTCGEVIELNHLMADPAICSCVRCRRADSRVLAAVM